MTKQKNMDRLYDALKKAQARYDDKTNDMTSETDFGEEMGAIRIAEAAIENEWMAIENEN